MNNKEELDQSTPNQKLNAQSRYCEQSRNPEFIPFDGKCFRCGKNIFDGDKGYTYLQASSELITGCPYCHMSFVD